MSGRLRSVVIATGLLAAVAGCQKTTLSKPVPNGITVDLATSSVSADAGTLTVTAQAYQDGVALLQEPIAFSITGGVTATGGTVATSGTSARASFTFTGLNTAGSGNVVVQTVAAGALVSASAPFSVVPGVPSSLTLSIPASTVAGSSNPFDWSAPVTDAHGNVIAGAGVSVTTNAPGAVVGTNGTISNLIVAGTWSVTAQYGTLGDQHTFAVTHAAAAQVQTSLTQTSVAEKSGTLDIFCKQMDTFGNDTFGTFVPAKVTTSPASTVTMVNGTSFTASSFVAAGAATARCDDGTHHDDKAFGIVLEGTPSVVATLSQSAVEAGTGATVKLSCTEVDAFGSDAGTVFTTGDVSIVPSGPSVTATTGGFTIGNLVTLGTFTATCTSPVAPNRSDSDTFAVADTQPPVIGAGAITAASEPGGFQSTVNADGAYASGATLTVHVAATDAVGVASEQVSIDDGSGFAFTWTHTESTPPTSAAQDIVARMPNGPTFTPFTMSVTATDVFGHVSPPTTTALHVDPGTALGAKGGVSIRTVFEGGVGAAIPFGMVESNGAFYVSNLDLSSGDEFFTRNSGPTSVTTIASDFVLGTSDTPQAGLAFAPGGFGAPTQQFFLPILANGGENDLFTLDGSTPQLFTTLPTQPTFVAYGLLGTANVLAVSSDNILYTADATGSVTELDSSVGGVIDALTIDSGLVWLGMNDGSIDTVDATGTVIPLGTSSDCPNYGYVVIDGADLLGGSGHQVCDMTISPAFANRAQVSQSFNAVFALAVGPAGELYVADAQAAGTFRIYKVTGF